MQYIAKDNTGYTEIVTPAEIITHCYLPSDASTSQINVWIKAARRWVERYCSVALVAKTVQVSYKNFPSGLGPLFLPMATECNRITSLSYLSSTGDTETIDLDNIVLCNIATPPYITPRITEWPTSGSNIIITYTATQHYDYEIYKPAIMMLVAHLAENREIVESKFTNSLTNLLAPLRVVYQP
jgi:hypothetical protein